MPKSTLFTIVPNSDVNRAAYAAAQCSVVTFFGGSCRVPRRVQIISISIFYFCSATRKTEKNKQTYRTIAEEEKGRSNKTLNVIACRQ